MVLFGGLLNLNIDSLSLLPKACVPFAAGIIPIALLIFRFAKNEKKKIFGILCTILIIYCLVFVIPILQTPVSYPPRVIFSFYTAQAVVFLIAFAFLEGNYKKVLCGICCIYLSIQIIFSNVIIANTYVSNALDISYAQLVYNEILKYEDATGIRVNKVATVNDGYCANSYDLVYYKKDQINERALGTVSYSLLEVVSGEERQFQKTDMNDEIYKRFFEGKDWGYFDASEQLIIENDTLYWAIF